MIQVATNQPLNRLFECVSTSALKGYCRMDPWSICVPSACGKFCSKLEVIRIDLTGNKTAVEMSSQSQVVSNRVD